MIIFLLLLFALCCYGMCFSSFHEDYMSVRSTTAIKGVFAIIILLSHVSQYFVLSNGISDQTFGFIMRYIGQLMVAAYFFYSGYGIAESIRNKKGYTYAFFKKRLLKTLFNFDLAVLLYVVLQSILRTHFETKNYILCWIGWCDIGNSSWFIFVILALYLITYAALLVKDWFHLSELFFAHIVTLLTIGLWLFLFFSKKPEYWWYDTLVVFPAGIWFSVIMNSVKGDVDFSTLKTRLLLSVILIASFLLWHRIVSIDDYGVCAILFILSMTAVTTFIKVNNPVLQWLGKQCFAIYIIQRIPTIIFSHWGLQRNPIVFTTLVIVFALLLAWGFTRVTDYFDKKLFS